MSNVDPWVTAKVTNTEVTQLSYGGEWLQNELRIAAHRLGKVAIIGHCFASDETLDSTLATALERQKPEVLQQLPGSFSVILAEQDRVVASTGYAGQFPLYYATSKEGAIISTNSLARGGKIVPDPLVAAHQIIVPGASELIGARAFFQGVSRVLPGETVRMSYQRIERSSGEIAINPHATFAETAEEFGAALQAAVESRVNSGQKISSDFSGGLDSTSLAFEALNFMDEPLDVFTYHDPSIPTGDIKYVLRYLALSDRLNPHILEISPNLLPYQQLDGAPVMQDFNKANLAWALYNRRFQEIQAAGSRLHMTGEGADVLTDATGAYLGDLIRNRKYGRFLDEAKIWAKVQYMAPYQVIKQAVRASQTSFNAGMNQLGESLLGPGVSSKTELVTSWYPQANTAVNWLSRHMRAELSELAYQAAHEVRIPKEMGACDYLARKAIASAGALQQSLRYHAATFGLSLHAPFLDDEVIRASLQIPVHDRFSPYEFKILMRHALKGHVPWEVISRETTGSYNEAHHRGMQAALQSLRGLMMNSRLADLGVIEPRRVIESLDNMSVDSDFPLTTVPRLMLLELWLRGLEQRNITSSVAAPVMVHEQTLLSPTAPEKSRFHPRYALPDYIYTASAPDGRLVLLNTNLSASKGAYEGLNYTASKLLRYLAETGDFEESVSRLAQDMPSIVFEKLKEASETCVAEWLERGWLIESDDAPGMYIPKNDAVKKTEAALDYEGDMRAYAKQERPRLMTAISTLGTFTIAIGLKKLPLKHTFRLLDKLNKKWIAQPADYDEAYEALAAAHYVASTYLGKAACLELPLAATLQLALRRRKVNWMIGGGFDPLRFHAWIMAGNRQVTTAADEQADGIYFAFEKNTILP